MNREELLKNAKPILFSTPMVQAILEGRKTVTRRIIKNVNSIYRPFEVGDVLYVRETWCENRGIYYYLADSKCGGKRGELDCPANIEHHVTCDLCSDYDAWIKWKPSIHMPKEAARIFLKVTNVKAERLQDITIDGIEHEGICLTYPIIRLIDSEHLKKFIELWNSTIKKQDLDKYGWEANPWVWVIKFERVEVKND